MKSKRHEKILELIRDNDIETQAQLLQQLQENGFNTTQATISRDIKQLRIIKELGPNGTYRYSASAKPVDTKTLIGSLIAPEATTAYFG